MSALKSSEAVLCFSTGLRNGVVGVTVPELEPVEFAAEDAVPGIDKVLLLLLLRALAMLLVLMVLMVSVSLPSCCDSVAAVASTVGRADIV